MYSVVQEVDSQRANSTWFVDVPYIRLDSDRRRKWQFSLPEGELSGIFLRTFRVLSNTPLYPPKSCALGQVAEMAIMEQSVVRSLPTNHLNIVRFHDAGISKADHEIRYYILSEYCPSNVLRKMNSAQVSLFVECVSVCLCVCVFLFLFVCV